LTRRSVNVLPQHMFCYLHDKPKSPACKISPFAAD